MAQINLLTVKCDCDGCKNQLNFDVHKVGAEHVADEILSKGWYTSDDLDICPACLESMTGEDIADMLADRAIARCEKALDEMLRIREESDTYN